MLLYITEVHTCYTLRPKKHSKKKLINKTAVLNNRQFINQVAIQTYLLIRLEILSTFLIIITVCTFNVVACG